MLSRQRQIEEIIKCGKDPSYFFNKYIKIQHPVRGLISFETFPFQDDCVKDFNTHRFNIVLKSRQMGLSTLSAAYAVWLAIFHKDQNILIIATKQKVAQNMIKKVKTALANLPPWLLLTQVVANNKQEVEFSNGSSIKAIPTSEDAGRSEALSLLIIDEAAHIRNFGDLWTSLYSTMSTGGRAIVLSTPNGVGNMYHELYSGAEAGLNNFHPIKLFWNVHPEHDQAWFENEARNLGSERKVAQELLCDFLSSGDTFVGENELKWITEMVKPPINRLGPDNNVWVWKIPLSEHKYILTADVSRGDAKDYSAFTIADIGEAEIVAEYKGKMRPDRFAELIMEIGGLYNNALVCPENNAYGFAVCSKLIDNNYPKLYYQESRGAFLGDYVPPDDLNKAGFATTGMSRPKILSKLEELLRNKRIKLYSSRFLDELKTFVWQSDKAQALRGRNDDIVMSMAIMAWLLDVADGYGKNSSAINQAMLAAMGTSRKQFKQPEIRGQGLRVNPYEQNPGNNKKSGFDSGSKRGINIMKDLNWLFD